MLCDIDLMFGMCVYNDKLQIKGVGMIRGEIGLKNRQIINETYSFRCFLVL